MMLKIGDTVKFDVYVDGTKTRTGKLVEFGCFDADGLDPKMATVKTKRGYSVTLVSKLEKI